MQLVAAPGGFLVVSPPSGARLIAAGDGSIRWETSLETSIAGEAAVIPGGEEGGHGGWIALPVEGGDVILLSLESGEPASRWELEWPEAILSSAGESLVALSPVGGAARYDPARREVAWRIDLPPLAPSPAASCGSSLLVGQADGRLLSIDAETGELRWRKNLGSPIMVRPTCLGKHAFVATADNFLRGLRLRRSRAGTKWRARSGGDPAAPPLARPDLALFLSKDTYLYGLRAGNGHLVFRTRLDRRPGPAVILHDLVIVSGSHVRQLNAFRLPGGHGAGAFSLPVGSRFLTPPVVSEEKVAFAVGRYGEESSTLVALEVTTEPDEPLIR
jgi:outer membrane protein assembly factor BamB